MSKKIRRSKAPKYSLFEALANTVKLPGRTAELFLTVVLASIVLKIIVTILK